MTFREIRIARETIILGMALGLMRFDEAEDVYEMTPAGHAWLRAWCEQKLAEHEAQP